VAEQLVAREDLARVPHEEDEQLELLGRQAHALAVQQHGPLPLGDGQPPAAQQGLGRGRVAAGLVKAAQDRADAAHDLAQVKGLGDVVVRAGLQAQELVVHAAARGEHDDGHVVGLRQHPAHVHAAQVRQHPVQQHQVRPLLLGHAQALGAGVGAAHGKALPPKAIGQDICNGLFIFHDQELFFGHGLPLRALSCLQYTAEIFPSCILRRHFLQFPSKK